MTITNITNTDYCYPHCEYTVNSACHMESPVIRRFWNRHWQNRR